MLRGKKRIAIIGSGLSGLVAAYELHKAIQAEQLPFEFILLEKRQQVGGNIKTIKTDAGLIDVGASSFDVRRDDIRPFLIELGLENEIQYSIGGKLDRFTGGEFVKSKKPSYHGIPLRFTDILHENQLSLSDKLSVLINHTFNNLQRGLDSYTTTTEFLEYRFCKAVSTMIAYPNYPENIYGSMDLCPPEFFDSNLIKLFEQKDSPAHFDDRNQDQYIDGDATEFNLRGGMATLVQALTDKIPDVILTEKSVTNLSVMDDNVYLMTLNGNESLRAKAILSTVSIADAYPLLHQSEQVALSVPRAHASSVATILYQFEKGVIDRYPEGYGFVVPKRSSYHITKATLLNRKWPEFQSAEHDVLLVEVGRHQEDTIVQLPDEAFLSIITSELEEILRLKGPYKAAKIYRFLKSVPHLSLEERQALAELKTTRKNEGTAPGFFLGGNGYHGYGMPNAIREGQRLAREALAYMKTGLTEL